MQTRREYAASLGLAKAGARGKFSNEAKAAIAKAEASGTKFSDSAPKEKVVKSPKATNSVKKESTGIIADIVYTYPEGEWQAREKVSKKLRGMREVCNTCRVSLVAHRCENPRIVATDGSGPVDVVIERK